jgi:hypothetical protein
MSRLSRSLDSGLALKLVAALTAVLLPSAALASGRPPAAGTKATAAAPGAAKEAPPPARAEASPEAKAAAKAGAKKAGKKVKTKNRAGTKK